MCVLNILVSVILDIKYGVVPGYSCINGSHELTYVCMLLINNNNNVMCFSRILFLLKELLCRKLQLWVSSLVDLSCLVKYPAEFLKSYESC